MEVTVRREAYLLSDEETMKILRHCAVIAFLVAFCATLTVADDPGRHPAYLHALTDLRHARAHLERMTPSERMDREEEHAIAEIDKAIAEIKRAAIDDGKNLNDHPPVDAHLGHTGRYRRALELLNSAHRDLEEKEDDRYAHGLRRRALGHIDEAHHIVEHLVVQAAN